MDFVAKVKSGEFDHLLIDADNVLPVDVEALERLSEEMTPSDLVAEDRTWISSSGVEGFAFNLTASWRFLHYCYYFRGPVKNVVNNLSMLTGTPEVQFERDADEKRWMEISEYNSMKWRFGYIVRNVYLWNDFFTIVFNKENRRLPKIRNLAPYGISEIKRDDEDEKDPETASRYIASNGTEYESEIVTHHVIDKVGNDMRGVPLFNAALREIGFVYKHLLDIYYLYHIRARLPVIRKVPNVRAYEKEKARFGYLPKPGRVVLETQNGDWTYPPEWRGAGNARDVYETYIVAIASAMNLPYFLVSGDYRNNSLASTLTANDPTVRLIRWYREQFSEQFKEIIKKAIGVTDVSFKWPPVLDRDKKKEAEAYEIGYRSGAISARTFCEDVFGKKWEGEDGEAARIRAERHESLSGMTPEAPPARLNNEIDK